MLRFPGELALVAVGGEGSGCIGSRAAMDSGFRADMCVIGEPTEQIIVPAHTGAVQLTITTRGVLRHTSTIPQLGTGGDAIAHMREVLGLLKRPSKTLTYERHPVLGVPLVCVGHVIGGQLGRPAWFSEECRCEIDIRTVPGMSAESVTADLERGFEKLKAKDSSFEAEIDIWEVSKNLLPVAIPKTHEVIKLARKAYRKVTGGSPKVGSPVPMRYYFTDACCWMNFGDVPTINFGAGALAEATPRGTSPDLGRHPDGEGVRRVTDIVVSPV